MAAHYSFYFTIVLRILHCLKGPLFMTYTYSQSPFPLRAYSDAWAEDPTDCHSTLGYCFLLCTSRISLRTNKQIFIAYYSIEAKNRALANTTFTLLSLWWLLQDMGVCISSATLVYYDNMSLIQIVHNNIFHE